MAGCELLPRRRQRRAIIVVVVVAIRHGHGVRRGFGTVRNSAHVEVRGLREVEDFASLDAPVREVPVHVVREEVREVGEVVLVRAELGRLLVAQVPVGAKSVRLRKRGDVDGVSISRVNKPDESSYSAGEIFYRPPAL